jgi:hypothetical protein
MAASSDRLLHLGDCVQLWSTSVEMTLEAFELQEGAWHAVCVWWDETRCEFRRQAFRPEALALVPREKPCRG